MTLTCGYSGFMTFSANLVRACSATAGSVGYCNGRTLVCTRSSLAPGSWVLTLARSGLTPAFPAVHGCSQQVRSMAGRRACTPPNAGWPTLTPESGSGQYGEAAEILQAAYHGVAGG